MCFDFKQGIVTSDSCYLVTLCLRVSFSKETPFVAGTTTEAVLSAC